MGYTSLPSSREHRTALVIDIRNGAPSQFVERYQRLLQSVNGPNIKVDVYTLRGNATASGPGLVAGAPSEYAAPNQPDQSLDLNRWAADLGYDQLLVVTSPAAAVGEDPDDC